MKGNSTSSHKKFIQQQHLFRGLISVFKNQNFKKERRLSPAAILRTGIRELLLDSRTSLHHSQYQKYLRWLHQQIHSQLPDFSRTPIGFDDLSGVVINPSVLSLEDEIVWITNRILVQKEQIRSFRVIVSSLEKHIFAGNVEKAVATLNDIQESHGASFWLIQLRIAIEQAFNGLESQKKYTQSVRNIFKNGLLNFIAYHTSVRNEERTTLAKFNEDIQARIENHKYYDQPIQTYLMYRLANELPESESKLADILRTEQSHSIIDLYETFVNLLQHLLSKGDLTSNLLSVIENSIDQLEPIEDYRFNKLKNLISGCNAGSLLIRDRALSDSLISQNFSRSISLIRPIYKHHDPIDCWQLIYYGLLKASISKPSGRSTSTPSTIPSLIGSIIQRQEGADASFTTLIKLTTNLKGLPVASGILRFSNQIKQETPETKWKPWLIGFDSPTFGVEDLKPNNSSNYGINASSPLTCRVWGCFLLGRDRTATVDKSIKSLFISANLINSNSIREAHRELNSIETTHALKPFHTALLLHTNLVLGNRSEVISLISNEAITSGSSRFFISIAACISSYSWEDFKKLNEPIDAAIALHLLWDITEDEKRLSQLRYITKIVTTKTGAQKPSELIEYQQLFKKHQLNYYLDQICSSKVLQLSRLCRGTKAVLEERQAICASLRELDPSNSDIYAQEVAEIANQQVIEEGQYIVDRSRIHVNVDGLIKWAERELHEDHARYLDLVDLSTDFNHDFDDVMKELSNPALASKMLNFKAESEADVLLYEILQKLSEQFLSNPDFGLNFYLSKRIRHQSFSGLIRGPAEDSQLITTKDSAGGQYERNSYFIDQFSELTNTEKESLEEAFIKFSTSFDKLLVGIKDNNFQIASEEKPEGLIYLHLPEGMIYLARALFTLDDTLQSFLDVAIPFLWAALDSSLKNVRRFITVNVKNEMVELFDQLQTTVKMVAIKDQACKHVTAEISTCCTNVQNALDEASLWFKKLDVEAQQRLFVLEQLVNIAVDSALKCQRGFTPIISKEVHSKSIKTVSSSLVFVHDVLFVALDNIRAHSGLRSPNVEITVVPDIENETLSIGVISDSKPSKRAENEKKLAESRAIFEEKNHKQKKASEGRSGFVKIAAVAHQSEKGMIDFGYQEDGRFKLSVVLSFIINKQPMMEVNTDDKCFAG